MQAGVPVIATDIAGNRDLVEDNRTDFSPDGRRRCVDEADRRVLLNPPERCRQLAETAQRNVLENFSVQSMLSKHEALYDSLIDNLKSSKA